MSQNIGASVVHDYDMHIFLGRQLRPSRRHPVLIENEPEILAPTALRTKSFIITSRERRSGTMRSVPMTTICVSGDARSHTCALPSLETRVQEPVSATPKLQPVTPMGAFMNSGRSVLRRKRVISSGSISAPRSPFAHGKDCEWKCGQSAAPAQQCAAKGALPAV